VPPAIAAPVAAVPEIAVFDEELGVLATPPPPPPPPPHAATSANTLTAKTALIIFDMTDPLEIDWRIQARSATRFKD
jgi:hypothetical protein